MAHHSEVKSENARNLILSYGENVYFVNKVNVQIKECTENLQAVFHARRYPTNEPEDLAIPINKETYDVLTEYAKLDHLTSFWFCRFKGRSEVVSYERKLDPHPEDEPSKSILHRLSIVLGSKVVDLFCNQPLSLYAFPRIFLLGVRLLVIQSKLALKSI
jgi:hypothetical protein